MARTVLITGSAGHLGRALRAAFEGLGDRVIGVDWEHEPTPDSMVMDLADYGNWVEWDWDKLNYDVAICNAYLKGWQAHEYIAQHARQSIINIGSIYGVLGNDPRIYEGTEIPPTPAWYAAAKGSLVALTKWQATNLAPVRSNCVCPGGIERSHGNTFIKNYSSRVPLGRMATEADIVPLVVFLASDAASYITGQVIMVDGGYGCW